MAKEEWPKEEVLGKKKPRSTLRKGWGEETYSFS